MSHPQQHFETIEVESMQAVCDGGGGALGHPRVYLHLDHETGDVTCPYCSRHYVMRGHQHGKAA